MDLMEGITHRPFSTGKAMQYGVLLIQGLDTDSHVVILFMTGILGGSVNNQMPHS